MTHFKNYFSHLLSKVQFLGRVMVIAYDNVDHSGL